MRKLVDFNKNSNFRKVKCQMISKYMKKSVALERNKK